jgi:hypothetical protein
VSRGSSDHTPADQHGSGRGFAGQGVVPAQVRCRLMQLPEPVHTAADSCAAAAGMLAALAVQQPLRQEPCTQPARTHDMAEEGWSPGLGGER